MRSRSCSASSHEALPPVDPEAPYEAPSEDSTAVNQSASPATEPGSPASAAADPPAAALQFDQVEPVAGAAAAPGLTCLRCRTPLPEQFWEVNGHATCAPCRTALIEQFTGPITWRTWGRVLLYGGGAALLGTLLYFAVLKLTGYEFGLIAIGVGLLVGGAVRKASGLRGGWRMQAAAMALTYASIVSSYIPSVYKGVISHEEKKEPAAKSAAPAISSAAASEAAASATPAAAPAAPPQGVMKSLGFLFLAGLFLFGLAAIAPIWAGFQNIMGWIIIGIALYEAWKLNRRIQLIVRGPLRLQPASASGTHPPVAVPVSVPPMDPPAR